MASHRLLLLAEVPSLLPSSRLRTSIVTTLNNNSAMMQKFVFFFLVALVSLLALVPSVEGAAIERRITNAERFAQGMTPLPPARRSNTQGTSELACIFRKNSVSSCEVIQPAARRSKPSNQPGDDHDGHDGEGDHDGHGGH